jgi:PAS domain S-box-containing protein
MDAILRLKKRYLLLLSVLLSEALASLMSLILNGRITYEFLITGGVVSLIVASILIVIITQSQKLIFERVVLQTEVKKHTRDLEETNTRHLKEIEERKLAEKRIVALIDALPDIIYFKNTESRNLVVNLSFAKLTGLKKEEVQGKTDMELLPPELAEHCRKQDEEVIASGRLMRYEEENTFHGKRMFQETIKVPLYDKKGDCSGLVGITRDITEQKLAEEKIRAALREKEVLLQEIHHRVKNNMQVITSLLKLQAGYIDDKKTVELFSESRNRIRAMALIHEKLYMSENLASIDFGQYVKSLLRVLGSSMRDMARGVEVKIDIDGITLNTDTAIPCGLIINELLTNCYKYAFPEGGGGEIRIELRREDTDELVLSVSDNGIGMPEDVDIRRPESLGIELVTLLAETQLKGRVELNTSEGTEFKIMFKELQYHKRV